MQATTDNTTDNTQLGAAMTASSSLKTREDQSSIAAIRKGSMPPAYTGLASSAQLPSATVQPRKTSLPPAMIIKTPTSSPVSSAAITSPKLSSAAKGIDMTKYFPRSSHVIIDGNTEKLNEAHIALLSADEKKKLETFVGILEKEFPEGM